MKTTFIVAALLNASDAIESATPHASNPKIVAQAHRNYERIERNLKNYTQTKAHLDGRFAQHGGQVIVWSQNTKPRKMVVRYYMEGNERGHYYFRNGRLFLVIEAKERFYFSHDKLVMWTRKNGRVHNGDRQLLLRHETEKLRDAHRFLAQTSKASVN
jgi:hypothetical protein